TLAYDKGEVTAKGALDEKTRANAEPGGSKEAKGRSTAKERSDHKDTAQTGAPLVKSPTVATADKADPDTARDPLPQSQNEVATKDTQKGNAGANKVPVEPAEAADRSPGKNAGDHKETGRPTLRRRNYLLPALPTRLRLSLRRRRTAPPAKAQAT